MKITLEKKFNNICVFLAPVRFHSHLSALLKTFISFQKYHFISKIMSFCAAQESMKITLEKKFNNGSLFPAPVHFQSHFSPLLKTLISFQKYHFI